jgi:hypothetical protein
MLFNAGNAMIKPLRPPIKKMAFWAQPLRLGLMRNHRGRAGYHHHRTVQPPVDVAHHRVWKFPFGGRCPCVSSASSYLLEKMACAVSIKGFMLLACGAWAGSISGPIIRIPIKTIINADAGLLQNAYRRSGNLQGLK